MLGDYRAAAAAYRRAANIAFTEPVAMRLVEAMRSSGDNAGAARVLELFLQQNPQNVPAQMLAANTLLQTGHWDDAIRIYENLRARLGNRDATLLNNLAWAWSQKGDYGRAIPYARRAWELDPQQPDHRRHARLAALQERPRQGPGPRPDRAGGPRARQPTAETRRNAGTRKGG